MKNNTSTTVENKNSANVFLKNVRLSFPQLFQPKRVQESEPKYSASFLLDKEDPQVRGLQQKIDALITSKWGGNRPKGIKTCLRDGAEKEFAGYEDTFYVSANSAKRP